MKRALLVSLIIASGCQTPPPSTWNGVWLSSSGEGVLVYSARDGGVEFSPRQLAALEGRLVLTQRCSDFDIASQGEVRLIEGKNTAGSVSERADGFELSFGSANFLSATANQVTRMDPPLGFRLEAHLTNDEFTLRSVFFDGGFELATERRFTVSKQTACR